MAGSSLLLPELAHSSSCPRILFELSGAHAGHGRCLTDLHSLFPWAVYHCHSHGPNQTLPPRPLCLQQPAFLKINRSASALRCTQTPVTPHCSLHVFFFSTLPIFHLSGSVHLITCVSLHLPHTAPHSLTVSSLLLSPSVSTDKLPQSFPFAPPLRYICN